MTNIEILRRAILADSNKDRSKWAKGVRLYAADLVEYLNDWDDDDIRDIFAAIRNKDTNALNYYFLNGARDWAQYSRGGSGVALIYCADIADRLATPSEIKSRTNKAGQLSSMANSREDWCDVEARALGQAERLIFNYLNRI